MRREVVLVALAVAACASVPLTACSSNVDDPVEGSGASAGAAGANSYGAVAGSYPGGSSGEDGGNAGGAAGSQALSGGNGGGQAGSQALNGCSGGSADDLDLSVCEIPRAALLSTIHAGAVLSFCTVSGAAVEVGTSADPAAASPDSWTEQDTVAIPASGAPQSLKVFARIEDPSCEGEAMFEHVYLIGDSYPGPAGDESSTAIAMADPAILGWASGWVEPVEYGTDVDDQWKTPEKAVGEAAGTATDVVALGNGGSITLTFDPPIGDGLGLDFVVFENGYSDTFLELAYVEVSSDGTHFVRFDSVYLGNSPVAQYGTHETALTEGLAGKYIQGFGGPFDLALLRYQPRVQAGQVDLSRVTHVRIVDIVGDGTALDSFGNPIYDPHPTVGSGGFDLDAIGVLNVAE